MEGTVIGCGILHMINNKFILIHGKGVFHSFDIGEVVKIIKTNKDDKTGDILTYVCISKTNLKEQIVSEQHLQCN